MHLAEESDYFTSTVAARSYDENLSQFYHEHKSQADFFDNRDTLPEIDQHRHLQSNDTNPISPDESDTSSSSSYDIRFWNTDEEPKNADLLSGHLLHQNQTSTPFTDLWSPTHSSEVWEDTFATMKEHDQAESSNEISLPHSINDLSLRNTTTAADGDFNLTQFLTDVSAHYLPSLSVNDSIFVFNQTSSPSSRAYDINSTFQFRANFSSENPRSFNFDLFPFFARVSPSPAGETPFRVDDSAFILVLKVLLLTLVSLVGSFGNVMVIWSVVKERHLHRPPFYFLLSLGVTDLSRAVFCVPVVITTVLHGSSWRHGESACKLFAFATSFFVFSSALSLLAIAVDRHISIVYSKTYRRRSPGIVNLVVAVIIWIVAFSVSFPPVVGVGDYVFIPDEAQCTYQHKHYSSNDSVASVLVFLAILFLTYFLYFRIFRFLRAHRRMRPLQHTPALSANWAFVGPGANGQAFINWLNGFGGQVPIRQGGQRSVQRLNFGRVVNLSSAKNEHLTRLFLVLTLVFGIMWSPYIVLSIWRIFFDTSLIPSPYVTVAAWLGYAQVAMCPMVYFMSRGPARKPTRTIYSHAEKREFLLENKIAK